MKTAETLVWIGSLVASLALGLWVHPWLAALPPLLLGLVRLTVSDRQQRLAFYLINLVMVICLYAGMVEFALYSQAVALIGANPLDLLTTMHPHAVRYLIAYPVIVFSDRTGVSLDQAYTVYGVILFILTIHLLVQICSLSASSKAQKWRQIVARSLLISASVVFIALFMNGRLIPAYLGLALILWAQAQSFCRSKVRMATRLGAQAMGIFLTMVSSGVLFVAVAQIVLVTLYLVMRMPNRQARLLYTGGMLGLIVLNLPIIWIAAVKNIDFYGGGIGAIWAMGTHGFGGLLRAPLQLMAAVIVGGLGMAVYYRLAKVVARRAPALTPALISIPVAGVLGVFGYAIATMVIPGVIVLAVALAMHPELITARSWSYPRSPRRPYVSRPAPVVRQPTRQTLEPVPLARIVGGSSDSPFD